MKTCIKNRRIRVMLDTVAFPPILVPLPQVEKQRRNPRKLPSSRQLQTRYSVSIKVDSEGPSKLSSELNNPSPYAWACSPTYTHNLKTNQQTLQSRFLIMLGVILHGFKNWVHVLRNWVSNNEIFPSRKGHCLICSWSVTSPQALANLPWISVEHYISVN